MVRTAVQTGLAKPVEKPRTTRNREKEADDGILKSQRILLTWMIDDANALQQIRRVIRSDDFTEATLSDGSRTSVSAVWMKA